MLRKVAGFQGYHIYRFRVIKGKPTGGKITTSPPFRLGLINCESNILLNYSEECIIVTGDYGHRKPKFAIIDTKRYIPVVTLSAQDNEKLLQQLKTGFKRTINCNNYESDSLHTKPIFKPLSWFMFSGNKQTFCLSFENDSHQNLQAIFSSDCRNKRLQCYDW